MSGGLAASTLAYDPAGRLKWISSTAFRRFLYDGDQAIAEYTSSNTLLRRFVPGAGADETLVWYEGSGLSNKSWIAADARGSVLAVMNSSGAATATNTYDAYGVPASTNSSLRFGYTGQMWLGEIGLYHYKARAYNPETGRFMQPDPIGYGDGLNMYAYVGNDPVNHIDPTGLCTGSRILAKDGSGQCAGGGWIAGSGSVSWGYGENRARRDSGSGGGGGSADCKICNWDGPADHAQPNSVDLNDPNLVSNILSGNGSANAFAGHLALRDAGVALELENGSYFYHVGYSSDANDNHEGYVVDSVWVGPYEIRASGPNALCFKTGGESAYCEVYGSDKYSSSIAIYKRGDFLTGAYPRAGTWAYCEVGFRPLWNVQTCRVVRGG